MLNQLKTIGLLGVLSALVIAIGGVAAPSAMPIFVVLALAMNVGAYFFSDRIVLRMHNARPLSREEAPRIFAMTEELARRAEIPMPRLYVIDDPQPNAFATGRNPAHGVVAVTTGIVRLLDERELRGVIAHEIAHIKNRDTLIATAAAALAAIITYAAHALGFFGASRDDEEGTSPLVALGLMIVAPIAATLVQLAISRAREYVADATAARLTEEPEALATALLALDRRAHALPHDAQPATASLFIVNPLSGGGVGNLFSTHPPIERRAQRLMDLAPASRRAAVYS